MLEIKEVFNNVYIIKDSYNNCSDLITGTEKALLFDTGIGVDDYQEKIREITDLPLIVINSHGHFDHIGGNFQFNQVYMNSKDLCILKKYSQGLLENWLETITKQKISLDGKYKPDFNVSILNFNSFNLGDLYCEIINLPGHSKGSIGILIPKLKLLLSGDALLPIITLNFDNHAGTKEELKTLEKVKNLDFDYYLTGHSDKVYSKDLITKLIDCLKNSLDKKHYYYEYPDPPYSPGYFYLDSNEEEPIGIIVAEKPIISDQN